MIEGFLILLLFFGLVFGYRALAREREIETELRLEEDVVVRERLAAYQEATGNVETKVSLKTRSADTYLKDKDKDFLILEDDMVPRYLSRQRIKNSRKGVLRRALDGCS